MPKTIQNSHIVGEAGVIKFAAFCNGHNPYLMFREVTKSDFGIDGEVELTRVNDDNKLEPTGEIIKVQIKSVNSDASYIKNERASSFEFHPRKDDLDYWKKYVAKGIPVALIIYDARKDLLFCKRIGDTEMYIGSQASKKGNGLARIMFDKTADQLDGSSDFRTQFPNAFTNRVNYGVRETLVVNVLKFKHHPKLLYAYKAKFKTKRSIYEHVTNDEAPYFVLSGNTIYTFLQLGTEYSSFKKAILEVTDSGTLISYDNILGDRQLTSKYSELLSIHLDATLRQRKLVYSKDYRRYYFRKPNDQDHLTVDFTTRKRRDESQKNVVKHFTYGKNSFFRHIAVEFKYQYIGRDVYLIVSPKYLFTTDGKTVLAPADVTKYTNFLTAREFNNQFCDWLNFWWSYLAKNGMDWTIYEHPAYKSARPPITASFISKHPRITVSSFQEETVGFGIYLDIQERKKKVDPLSDVTQTTLF